MAKQKQVATPKDKKAENRAILIQQELYLLEGKPSNDANAKRRKVLKSELDAVVSNIVGDTKLGGGRARILDVIKQAALARNRKDRGEPPKKVIETPISPPDKTFTELYKEQRKKRLPNVFSPLETATAATMAAYKKLTGDDKRKNKGGVILKTNKEKMAYGGMASGKKHMYATGGSVKDNAGLRALQKASPMAYNKIKGIV
jgi:hypothetical protein